MNAENSEILIVGGGIGGLTMALALPPWHVPCKALLHELCQVGAPIGVELVQYRLTDTGNVMSIVAVLSNQRRQVRNDCWKHCQYRYSQL